MKRLACTVFLTDVTLEFDTVGVVLRHDFHPWKARRPRSIPNPRPSRGRNEGAQVIVKRVRLIPVPSNGALPLGPTQHFATAGCQPWINKNLGVRGHCAFAGTASAIIAAHNKQDAAACLAKRR